MMSHGLASWQSANNYRKEGDVVYGVFQGCGFTVSEEDGGKLFIFMLSARDDGAFDDFENALVAAGGAMAEGQVGDVENYLAVFYDESHGEMPHSAMDAILNFTATRAKQLGFRVPNVCVKCGARATKRSFVDNMVQPLCADCSEQNKQKRRAAAVSAPAPAPQPEYYDNYSSGGNNNYGSYDNAPAEQDDEYANQYAPIVADSSKYDDSYDEYAGMTPQHSDYTSDYGNYSDQYSGTVQGYDGDSSAQDDYSGNSYGGGMSFSDNGEDDYRAVMGDDNDYASNSDIALGGNMGKGVLGALVGALVGVALYLILALAAHFPMGALCFPAGMLAVVFYTMFGGIRVKSTGMGISIGISTVISLIVVFFTSIFSYTNQTTDFSGAMSYLFGDSTQTMLLVINLVLSVLGSVFGACLLIDVMGKYVGDDNSKKSGASEDKFREFN